MRLLRGLAFRRPVYSGAAVTIGNFDGFHRGHQAVVSRLLDAGARLNAPTVLITFEPLPLEFFAPERAPGRLQRLRDRIDFLRTTGLDAVWLMRFGPGLAGLPAETFVERVLHDTLAARHVLVGDDFRFGKGRTGDYALLERMGTGMGFSVEATPTLTDDAGRISSTRVRAAAQAGDFDAVAQLLGRRYAICGRVSHGDKRGRVIGFPTANVRLGPQPLALRGVFAGWLCPRGGERMPAVTNIGWRPTVAGREQRLEAHVLDASPDLYGQLVRFEPLAHLRGEQRFESLDALKAQIAHDVAAARAVFANLSLHQPV
ncbi:Riboflavin kinase / FMN adenylyltransferase [Thioalkalivibrio nitratireducens DSM 14787]|uniref:Riboflavin biosynthesis protein n=1 Tax=Thioalkalivibrio nitratireducens (strain DSM 14787 / UNIQEM 213 / ALEN2) TaxID=1255043 RepID=L0DSC9_THIND|nr:bifunctional riboflavin kinase/FAD synthetase [Thioalkalivibrio nitratireducens]AGA31880.1 Riboflavin kinase / FMN adenylyltransferase [Thioalkalivibrio nitratireducens DSM 14787]